MYNALRTRGGEDGPARGWYAQQLGDAQPTVVLGAAVRSYRVPGRRPQQQRPALCLPASCQWPACAVGISRPSLPVTAPLLSQPSFADHRPRRLADGLQCVRSAASGAARALEGPSPALLACTRPCPLRSSARRPAPAAPPPRLFPCFSCCSHFRYPLPLCSRCFSLVLRL